MAAGARLGSTLAVALAAAVVAAEGSSTGSSAVVSVGTEGKVVYNERGRVQTVEDRLALVPYLPGRRNTTFFDLLTNVTEQLTSLTWIYDSQKKPEENKETFERFFLGYASRLPSFLASTTTTTTTAAPVPETAAAEGRRRLEEAEEAEAAAMTQQAAPASSASAAVQTTDTPATSPTPTAASSAAGENSTTTTTGATTETTAATQTTAATETTTMEPIKLGDSSLYLDKEWLDRWVLGSKKLREKSVQRQEGVLREAYGIDVEEHLAQLLAQNDGNFIPFRGLGHFYRQKRLEAMGRQVPISTLTEVEESLAIIIPLGVGKLWASFNALESLAMDDRFPKELLFIMSNEEFALDPALFKEHLKLLALFFNLLSQYYGPDLFPQGTRVAWGVFNGTAGPSIGRWVGMNSATTEFVTFYDNDDLFFPGRMQDKLELLENRPDIDMVLQSYYLLAIDGNMTWENMIDSIARSLLYENIEAARERLSKDYYGTADATSPATADSTAAAAQQTSATQAKDFGNAIIAAANAAESAAQPAPAVSGYYMNEVNIQFIRETFVNSWESNFSTTFLMGSVAGLPQLAYWPNLPGIPEKAEKLREQRGLVLQHAASPLTVPMAWNASADPLLIAREKADIKYMSSVIENAPTYAARYHRFCHNGWITGRRKAMLAIPPNPMKYGEDALYNFMAMASGFNVWCMNEITAAAYVRFRDGAPNILIPPSEPAAA